MNHRFSPLCSASSSSSVTMWWWCMLLLLCGSALDQIQLCEAVNGKTRTDFIDCSNPCNGGDVNYHLITSTRTMPLLNYTYRGRTYSREGSNTFMGPTMHVKPGQSIWIKLENQFVPKDASEVQPPTALDYWKMLEKPGERIKYTFYKKGVPDYKQLKVDHANMPHNFDVTNLHLHGLDIAVHMFDPVGTTQKYAPHIAVRPGQCYCYQFDIPSHHPDGMYWYHPHLHGSSAIQIWAGMLGLLYVEGPLLDELKAYNIRNTQEFVIWDPAFQAVPDNPEYNLRVDEFLLGQTTLSKIHPFLVNGQENPTFTIRRQEVLHLRTLCATIENENTFIIYPQGRENEPWHDETVVVPFYVIAADGVTYPKSQRKTILVMSGGQRYEILIQIDSPGRYVISQQGIQGMQFFDMYGHPHDQILATIQVLPEEGELPLVPLDQVTLTPGYKPEESIQSHEIVASETIVFSMGTNRDQVPFPQYYVNGKPFDPNRLDLHAHPGEAREYLLVNANHNVHPFHIHVNRFQVKEMGSELSVQKYPALSAVLDFDPNAWRDTVVVPPNGRARIWVQYKNYTGKTVFHCHFLAHEDTGMMATLFIGPVDWVFEWEHHGTLVLLGLLLLVSGTLLALLFYYRNNRQGPVPYYTAVEMNQVKSKIQD